MKTLIGAAAGTIVGATGMYVWIRVWRTALTWLFSLGDD